MKRLLTILIAIVLAMQVLLSCGTANTAASSEGTNIQSTDQDLNIYFVVVFVINIISYPKSISGSTHRN